jgi:hypothetical protein
VSEVRNRANKSGVILPKSDFPPFPEEGTIAHRAKASKSRLYAASVCTDRPLLPVGG